jgi:hypothetical protein
MSRNDATLPVCWTLVTWCTIALQIAAADCRGAHRDHHLTAARNRFWKRAEHYLAVSRKEKALHDVSPARYASGEQLST